MFARLARTSSAPIVASVGLDCAGELDEKDPRRAELLAYFEKVGHETALDREIEMAADDRSGLFISLLSAREAAKDSVGERTVASEWSQFLDDAAAHAKNPDERTVFDSHRLSAYLQLDTPERAVPMLQQSERDFPDDYNPPYRLAIAYRAMEQWDDALAATERAAERAYGPRLISILRTRGDLFVSKGDPAGAKQAYETAIAQAEALPELQRSERTIEQLRTKLAELGDTASPATGD
ncbi:MAG: tetratricopeptide repeat protein [Candidatus Eisenbacteria bacterium]